MQAGDERGVIYTTGYSQWTPETLEQRVDQVNGLLCDIRYQPRSRVRHWNQKPLQERFGERYCHMVELGNMNYKSGPIALSDVDAGLERVRAVLQAARYTPILMCVCQDARSCHRSLVAQHIQQVFNIMPRELRDSPGSEGESQLQLPL